MEITFVMEIDDHDYHHTNIFGNFKNNSEFVSISR